MSYDSHDILPDGFTDCLQNAFSRKLAWFLPCSAGEHNPVCPVTAAGERSKEDTDDKAVGQTKPLLELPVKIWAFYIHQCFTL